MAIAENLDGELIVQSNLELTPSVLDVIWVYGQIEVFPGLSRIEWLSIWKNHKPNTKIWAYFKDIFIMQVPKVPYEISIFIYQSTVT